MLEIKNVSKYYDDLCAVDNLSFDVKDGEIFGLLGVNGAGKTTTFRMIMGLLKPDSGTILLDGKPIDYSATDSIGFLLEERSLLTKMKVYDQIYYYASLKGMSKKTIDERIDYYLDKLGIIEYKYKTIKELSKGNQQKIQFISSIINNPKLLLLDEPFNGLDPFNVSILIDLLKELEKNGTSIIFSTHRMEHVEMFCDRLTILVKGKSIVSGSLKSIRSKYKMKTIVVNGSIDINKIKKINGVIDINSNDSEHVIKINDYDVSKKVFDIVKEGNDILEYKIIEPSLDEIFVSIVGDKYE